MSRLLIPGGDETIVADGSYGPASYSNLHGVTIRAQNPGKAIFSGDPDQGTHNCIRFMEGCDVTVRGMVFRNFWRALWPVGSKIAVEDCLFENNGELGLMPGACTATVRRCTVRNSGKGSKPRHPDHPEISANHAYYFSFGCQDSGLYDSDGIDCQGCGIHALRNDGSDDGSEAAFQHNLHVENVRLIRCGSEGTAAVQYDGVADSILKNVLIADCNAGVTFYNDGAGPKWSCRNIFFEKITLYNPQGKFNFHFSPGTKGISIAHSVLVLCDAPMFEGTDDGMGEIASVDQTVIYCHNADHVPAAIRANPTNSIRAIEDVVHLFPGAPQGNYTPADPNMTFGWHPLAPAPPANPN